MPVMTVGTGRALLGRARRWWEADGATGCLVAYQPKGAASYAASKVNLAAPGTGDATEGVAPGWSAVGWTFNGSSHYLRTGVVVGVTTFTMLVQFTDFAGGPANTICGAYASSNAGFLIQSLGSAIRSFNGPDVTNAPMLGAGNLAVAGKQPYRNGVPEAGLIPAGGTGPSREIFVGVLNATAGLTQYAAVTVTALAIYDNTLTPAKVAGVAAAMAIL